MDPPPTYGDATILLPLSSSTSFAASNQLLTNECNEITLVTLSDFKLKTPISIQRPRRSFLIPPNEIPYYSLQCSCSVGSSVSSKFMHSNRCVAIELIIMSLLVRLLDAAPNWLCGALMMIPSALRVDAPKLPTKGKNDEDPNHSRVASRLSALSRFNWFFKGGPTGVGLHRISWLVPITWSTLWR